MDAETARLLRRLLMERPVATLATLHRGEPATSMVPFVLQAEAGRLLIHVSALATHSADMRAHPRVSLLVMGDSAAEGAGSPLALPRVSLAAAALPLAVDDLGYEEARAAYLQRFADAEPMFEFADFSLVALMPRSARLVAGFGRAHSLNGAGLQRWLRGEPAPS